MARRLPGSLGTRQVPLHEVARLPRWLQAALGLAVSLVCGWLAVRHVSWHAVGQALQDARYVWLVPAFAALMLAVVLRAERWRMVFAPGQRPPLSAAFWSMNIGYLFNNLLPARAGEVARVLALSRETGIPRTYGFVTVVVERIFDLASLALLLLACLFLVPDSALAHDLTVASLAILAASAVVVGLLAIEPLRARALRLVAKLPVLGGAQTGATAASFRQGVSALRNPRLALPVAGWSLASWLALALSNWFALRAFTTDTPWSAAVFVLVATNLAMALPSGAGAIGVFEWAARSALAAYGVPRAVGLSAALVLHALNSLPYLVLGAIALARLGATSRELLRPAADGA